VKLAIEDDGLAAVVVMEVERRVSGDSPTVDACDFLSFGIDMPEALGVTDLRPVVPYDRHKSLVKSRTSLAMESKAAE
jgi:hypothetical protein